MSTHVDELAGLVNAELGVSEWIVIDQERIGQFADATGDEQWIHVDEASALAGPFGATIAHGYLTLSLIPMLLAPITDFDGVSMKLNYGVDHVRFPHPVPVNARIRVRASVRTVEARARGLLVSIACVLQIDGIDTPACVADQLLLLVRP